MRIVLIGQSDFGKAVLEALVKSGETVVAAFCPPEKPGEPADPVREASTAAGIPCLQFKRMRSPEAIQAFRSLESDLAVMAFVTDIVPMEVINAPRLGTVQYHPSLLPKHRGPSSINWPIIAGETFTGLTVFWPDAGLDTGPILLQKRVEISPDDTLGTLYFNRLFPMGVEAMSEAVRLVRDGRAPRIPQDESQATYEGWCTDEHAAIDWSKPARQVYNLVRGCNPRPGAFTLRDGVRLRLFDSAVTSGVAGAAPGTVTAVAGEGVAVACGDGGLLVKRVQPEGSKKLSAAEYAAASALTPGVRFGVR
jgi:methionyl-tRNA formyltransferase